MGATEAFDYRDPTAIKKLKAATEAQGLTRGWDTIGTEGSRQFIMDALDQGPDLRYGVAGYPSPKLSRDDVVNVGTLMVSSSTALSLNMTLTLAQ